MSRTYKYQIGDVVRVAGGDDAQFEGLVGTVLEESTYPYVEFPDIDFGHSGPFRDGRKTCWATSQHNLMPEPNVISAAAHVDQFKVGDKVFARHDGAWFDRLNGIVDAVHSKSVVVDFVGEGASVDNKLWWFFEGGKGTEDSPLLTDLIILRDAPAEDPPAVNYEDHKLFTVLTTFRDMTKAQRDEALAVLAVRYADSMPI